MKPDYRISLTITALLIVAALIMPPWKDQLDGLFVDFYYVFSEEIPKFKWVGDSLIPASLEIDYARLAIEIIGIILIMLAIHSLMFMPLITNLLVNVLSFIRNYKYLILITFAMLLFLYFDKFSTEKSVVPMLIGVVMIVLLFGLTFGTFKLKSGIKALDSEVGKGNIGDYANLIKIILLGLAALVGLLTDFLSNL